MLLSGVQRLFRVLDAERAAGEEIARTMLRTPPSTWGDLISAHPHWLRFGTFEFLVHAAESSVLRNPRRTATMTSFILTYIVHMPSPSDVDLLVQSLAAHAWIVHGMAFLELGDYARALDASEWAQIRTGDQPVLSLDRADAELLSARVYRRTRREQDALDALSSCLAIFQDFGDVLRYGEVLTERSILLARTGRVRDGQVAFLFAEELLQSLCDPRADAMLRAAIAACPELAEMCPDARQVIRLPSLC